MLEYAKEKPDAVEEVKFIYLRRYAKKPQGCPKFVPSTP